MYDQERQQLEARQKLMNALMQQSMTPQQTQMVSGRAVPQGIAGILTPLLQQQIAKKGSGEIAQRSQELQQQEQMGTKDALREMIDKFKGRPENAPEAVGGPAIGPTRPAQAPDVLGGAMMAGDPRLQGNKGAQMVAEAMLNQQYGKAGSSAKPTGSSAGYFVMGPDGRPQMIKHPETGKELMPPPADITNVYGTSGARERAKLEQQLGLKPSIESSVVTSKGMAERGLEQPKETFRKDTIISNITSLKDVANQLKEHKGLEGITGGIYGRIPSISDESINAQSLLDSLKSKIFISALQSMREASKTGGAVGNVSDKEGDRLENSMKALSQIQTTDKMREELGKLAEQLDGSISRINKAYEDTYGGKNVDNKAGAKPQDLDQSIWDAMTPEEKALF